MAAIGIDLDGVCYNFDLAMRSWLKYRGYGDLPVPTQWKCYEDWGMSEDEWFSEFIISIDKKFMFLIGDPVENTVEVLRSFMAEGHSIHIVTHRVFGKFSVENTCDWLRKHDFPYDTLTFAKDKTTVKTDYFVDDRYENYMDVRNAGIRSFIFNQPWNEEFIDVPGEDRVRDLKDFYHKVNDDLIVKGF